MQIKSHRRPRAVGRQRGFTIIETLVVVAILGVLAALAAPSFQTLVQNWRIRQVAEGFSASLSLARSEAMRRGGNVIVRRRPEAEGGCPDIDLTSPKEWSCGWFTFVDKDGDGELDEGEVILRSYPIASGVRLTRSRPAAFFRISQWGRAAGAGIGFSVESRAEKFGTPVAICISSGGRVDLRRGATECQ